MYLLLRNNKQSGPYSLEELKSMGLKAYDLVWLEGKSAAWRYPCELAELKDFAPAVEEQPFDRFYKRPSAAGAVNASTAGGTTLTVKTAETSIPVTVESTKTPGKRIIYVTMPAGRGPANPMPMREPTREAIQTMREPVQTMREPVQTMREPAREPILRPAPVNAAPIIDYAAPIPESDPVMEYSTRRKPRRNTQVIRLLAISFCILALLAAGIFIGLTLNKDTLPFSSRVVAKIPPAGTDQSIVHPTLQQLPAAASANPAGTNNQRKPVDSSASIVNHPATSSPVDIAKPAMTPRTASRNGKWTKQSHSPNQANATPKKDSAAGGLVREAVHRADVEPEHHDNVELPDKETVKMELASQVSVGANGYSVGTFGGISGLQLTVTNRSVYPLDLVTVEVQYIQANKKIYKTENLFFRSIGAGSALMQEAPKSSRGIRVQYKITNISSKELGLSYSGI